MRNCISIVLLFVLFLACSISNNDLTYKSDSEQLLKLLKQYQEEKYSDKPEEKSDSIIVQNTVSPFKYDPQGKEEFVLYELDSKVQENGYDDFYLTVRPLLKKADMYYSKYKFKKGYFVSNEPVYSAYPLYYYKVILENGEELFYRSLRHNEDRLYSSFSQLIPLKIYNIIRDFSPEPFVKNSKIEIIDCSLDVLGNIEYTLSTGETIDKSDLIEIRQFIKKFNNSPEIAELLLNKWIREDKVDDQTFIHVANNKIRDMYEFYIGFNNDKCWLRLQVQYSGYNWLFVYNYKIAADDYKWQSENLTFKRDHSGGEVWEWVDKPATDQDIFNAQKILNAKEPIIRFRGSKYYSDFYLKDDDIKNIKDMLRLFELIKENFPK